MGVTTVVASVLATDATVSITAATSATNLAVVCTGSMVPARRS